jgi:hypothetical protein
MGTPSAAILRWALSLDATPMNQVHCLPTVEQLLEHVHFVLCEKDNLDPKQTPLAHSVIVRRASLVYIPGGNTFLLNHRLHASRLMKCTAKMKAQNGNPRVALAHSLYKEHPGRASASTT